MSWREIMLAAVAVGSRPADASCQWHGHEQLRLTGEVRQGGLRGDFSRIVAPRSGRFAEAMALGTLKSGSGFDGRLAWSRDVSGASHYLNSEFARKLAVSEAWLKGHIGCGPPGRRMHASLARIDKPTGRAVWRATPPGGAPIELWYDRRSGRLDRAVLQYPENRIIRHYSGWREIGAGNIFPFVERAEDPEDEDETLYVIRTVAKVAGKSSFAPPSRPNDSRISGGGETTIPFEDDGRRRIYLPVYLNGKGPFAFELDNGGHFIVTEATAKALGLSGEGNFSSTGAGNQVRQGGFATIATIRVGNAEMSNQPAKVLALSKNERGTSLPRAGILGLEFFERFVVAIDHRAKTVTLRSFGEREAPKRGRPLPLLFDEDAPLVSGGFAGIGGNVMLDIGNAGPTIIEHHWAAEHGLTARLATGRTRGTATLTTGAVRIGPFELDDETVAYHGAGERGSESTRSIAAVIGEPLLSRFNAIYDYGRGTVWLERLAAPPLSFQP